MPPETDFVAHCHSPRTIALKLSTNKGHQNALLAGLEYASTRCDCAISIDCDLQQDEQKLDEFIQKYNLEQYDSMSPEDFEQVGGNSEIVDIAKSKLGCPYVWGATGPDTFDCSGLVQWVYAQAGISVPRTTYDYEPYLGTSKEISWSEAQPGDIVWNDHHMGIYLGNDEFIHAPQTGDVVKISSGASGRFTNVFRFTN